jgi:hypothetical protein
MLLVGTFGIAKAALTYHGTTMTPMALDWVLGVIVTALCVLCYLPTTVKPPDADSRQDVLSQSLREAGLSYGALVLQMAFIAYIRLHTTTNLDR